MNTLNYFFYGGRSSREFGLYITGQPYSSAERDVETIEIPGRSGNLLIDNGRFKDTDVTYHAYLKHDMELLSRAVKSWLLKDSTSTPLYDSYDPTYFRYGYYTGPLDIAHQLNRVGECDITFHCRPHIYSRSGQSVIRIMGPLTLTNPESFESAPLITIYGQGDIELRVGDCVVLLSDIDEYAVLDCDSMQVYKETKNLSAQMTGLFPKLLPGDNSIEFAGAEKVDVVPRWRTV